MELKFVSLFVCLFRRNVELKLVRLLVCLFVCLFRRNVELKKVNSKYILKSTLTPQLSRKQLHGSTSSIERCQSWPTVVQTDSNSEMKFYLGPVSAQSVELLMNW